MTQPEVVTQLNPPVVPVVFVVFFVQSSAQQSTQQPKVVTQSEPLVVQVRPRVVPVVFVVSVVQSSAQQSSAQQSHLQKSQEPDVLSTVAIDNGLVVAPRPVVAPDPQTNVPRPPEVSTPPVVVKTFLLMLHRPSWPLVVVDPVSLSAKSERYLSKSQPYLFPVSKSGKLRSSANF